MTYPDTPLHYVSTGSVVNGTYLPGDTGFNLVDITYASQLSELPAGDQALVWLDEQNGVTSSFVQHVQSVMAADPSAVYGFYVADEPLPSATTAANLRAESDWIHANYPGEKTFIVEYNERGPTDHLYYYNPSNSHVDLYGLDPYPVQDDVPGGYDLNIIANAVQAAESIGIPDANLVPVYQAFGDGMNNLPTPDQEQQIVAEWGSLLPSPAFDYTTSWGLQDGTVSLESQPNLQHVLKGIFDASASPTAASPATPTLPNEAADLAGALAPPDGAGAATPRSDIATPQTPSLAASLNTHP